MTENELVAFLKQKLRLEIIEETSPYQALTHRRFVFKLALVTAPDNITLSEQTLTIHEGR